MVFDLGVLVSEPPKYPTLPDYADSLTLSHAHLDHSGMAPALYKKQSLPIYATELTFQLSQVLQEDNIKVTEQQGYPLPYNPKDIQKSITGRIAMGYRQPRNIHSGISMQLYDAGHIPGSASPLLELEGRKLLYTGDINDKDTRLLAGADVPEADILVMESTYGDRLHPLRDSSEKALLAAINNTLDAGGVALLPVFAVGRSQEILMVLEKLDAPIYLDGMAKLATKITIANGGFVRDALELRRAANHSTWIEHDHQRRELTNEPCVILTTAGMLNGGPVIQYMRSLAGDRKNSILLTGYQVEGTNGRLLLEKGHIIDPDTKGRLPVSASVRQFDFSAHADQKGLLEIADKADPSEIILMHGSPEATAALEAKLSEEGYKVHAPEIGETIEL
ncbi:MAG: MBL fold metallo-hydrolase [Candidatus Altiarchaeota archaeon]|nr:MBL fold metallo-hydrolase [Candidatus Altiarchaeota archaeon]